jgi:hypothetical protein
VLIVGKNISIIDYCCHHKIVLEMAKHLDDVENCMEIILAIENDCTFVTEDKSLASRYKYVENIWVI